MKKDSGKNKNLTPSARPALTFDSIIEAVLLVIVFLAPIIFDRRAGIVFSGTKVAWLRTLVIVVLSLWAIKLLISRRPAFIRSPLDWPILSFLLTTTIATITSVHVYTSFTGFYGRFEGLSTWYVYGLLFFFAANFIRSTRQIKRVIAAVIPAATIMAVYSIIQRQELDPYMWGGVITWQRVIGTIGQPNFIAAYILMAFFIILALFLEEKKPPPEGAEIDWYEQFLPLGYFLASQIGFFVMIYTMEAQDVIPWYLGFGIITAAALLFAYAYEKMHPLILEILLGACLVLTYICLLYTQSRGGYVGFFTGAVLFVAVAGRHWIFKNWKKISLIGFFIFAVSAATMLNPDYSPFQRFTSEIEVKQDVAAENDSRLELKGAAGSRGETWKSAFGIIADNPLFGIGPEVMKMIFPRYETELFRFKETFHVKQDRSHNETFDIPVTKGMLSFALYLWILFTVFKTGAGKLNSLSENQRLILAGLLAAILSYLMQNQFSFGVVAITSLFWVLWAVVMVLGREEEGLEGKRKEEEGFGGIKWDEIPYLPAAGVLIAAAFMIYLSFLSFRSDIYFKSGKTNLEARNLTAAAEDLKKSLEVFPLEGTTISHLGIVYLNMGNTAEAEKYLLYGTMVDPYNADNFYMLSKLYLSLYDLGNKAAFGRAEKNVEIALKIDPYYAEGYEAKGLLFEKQGNTAAAAKMYEQAFAVNPTLPGPIQKLVQFGGARELFEEAHRRFPENIEIFKALEKLK